MNNVQQPERLLYIARRYRSAAMSEAPTIASTLRRAADELRDAGVSEAQLVAQSLLAEALGRDRTYLIVNFQQPLAEDEIARFDRLLERRAAGEPLQYITGRQ